jgi:hypothetical protein
LDLRHVWVEYAEKGLRAMKPVHTLRLLLTQPGQLTVDYVAGKRKSQANPFALLATFLALHLSVVKLQDVTPDLFRGVEALPLEAEQLASIEAAVATALPTLMVFLVYVVPLVTLPLEASVLWLLGERDALKAAVFTLHVTIFTYLVAISTQLMALALPAQGQVMFASLTGVAVSLVALAYTLLAFRKVYPTMPWARVLAVILAQWVVPSLVIIAGLVVVAVLSFFGGLGYALAT